MKPLDRGLPEVSFCDRVASWYGLYTVLYKIHSDVNISFSEIVVIFLVALLLFGPEQLPVLARQFGALAGELRKGSQALRREWYNAVYPPAEELRRDLSAHSGDLKALKAEVLAPPPGTVGTPTKHARTPTDQANPEAGSQGDPQQGGKV